MRLIYTFGVLVGLVLLSGAAMSPTTITEWTTKTEIVDPAGDVRAETQVFLSPIYIAQDASKPVRAFALTMTIYVNRIALGGARCCEALLAEDAKVLDLSGGIIEKNMSKFIAANALGMDELAKKYSLSDDQPSFSWKLIVHPRETLTLGEVKEPNDIVIEFIMK